MDVQKFILLEQVLTISMQ